VTPGNGRAIMATVEQLTFGDGTAAASVIAKVHRDRLMSGLGPGEFAFAENAGYPSPAHQEALAALGPTQHHRLSWSYLDDLPRWRHLKRHRPDVEGQLSLL
jgi:ribonuclease HII